MKLTFVTDIRSVILLSFLIASMPAKLQAETVYVTDNLLVGLHEEKSIDSAILKVLPTGTSLEVIKRENDFVHVRDPKGVTGWISNSYLMTNNPANPAGGDDASAQTRIKQLEAELENIKLQTTTSQNAGTNQNQVQVKNSDELLNELAKLKTENETLKQQINSDKLKSGELQAKLAELRNKISQSQDNNKGDQELTEQIGLLSEHNTQLQTQMEQLTKGSDDTLASLQNLNIMIITGILFLAGLIIGMILMDRRIRNRHGGLRL